MIINDGTEDMINKCWLFVIQTLALTPHIPKALGSRYQLSETKSKGSSSHVTWCSSAQPICPTHVSQELLLAQSLTCQSCSLYLVDGMDFIL